MVEYSGHCRLDAIACDAELQEKSEAELQRLADTLMAQCEDAAQQFENEDHSQQEGVLLGILLVL